MPPIIVKDFQGVHTKFDGIVENPAVASDCRNILFYQGDIVNMPYYKRKIVAAISARVSMIAQYDIGTKSYIIYKNNTEKHFTIYNIDTFLEHISRFDMFSRFFNIDDIRLTGYFPGWIQLENWLIPLADLKVGQMIKIIDLSEGNDSSDFKMLTFGLKAPSNVEITPISGGSSQNEGSWEFAVTFITAINTKDGDTVLAVNDIESNAFIADEVTATSTNNAFRFKIYLPENYSGFVPNDSSIPLGVGIYSRQTGAGDFQSESRLFKYIVDIRTRTLVRDTTTGTFYFQIDITDAITQEPNKFPALVGEGGLPERGSHNVPLPADVGIIYKNKLYLNNISNYLDRNMLQVSSAQVLGDLDPARHFNYIERVEPIGKIDEKITAIVPYLNQLILFKFNEAFLLTDDIDAGGSIIPLFEDVGCVSGKSVVNINNIIYWFALDGVYRWAGGNIEKISDPIKETIDEIIAKGHQELRFISFAVDKTNKQLYIKAAFSQRRVPVGFAYNYEENKWSILDTEHIPQEIFIYTKFDTNNIDTGSIIYAHGFRSGLIKHIKNLQENGEADDIRVWSWKSSKLTMGDQSRTKHWRFLELLTKTKFPRSRLELPIVKFITDDSEFTQEFNNGEAYAGLHSESLQFEMKQRTNKAFRINGYKLEAHIKRRR